MGQKSKQAVRAKGNLAVVLLLDQAIGGNGILALDNETDP